MHSFLSGLIIFCGFIYFPYGWSDAAQDKQEILQIFKTIDGQSKTLDAQLEHIVEDIIHMPHNQKAIHGKAAYKAHLIKTWSEGKNQMQHILYEVYPYNDIVVARGSAEGVFTPNESEQSYPYKTKNLFLFRRTENGLKIWQIIYNMEPDLTY